MWGSYTFFSKEKDLFLTHESVKAEKPSYDRTDGFLFTGCSRGSLLYCRGTWANQRQISRNIISASKEIVGDVLWLSIWNGMTYHQKDYALKLVTFPGFRTVDYIRKIVRREGAVLQV